MDALGRPDAWAEVFSAHERAVLRLADAMSGDVHLDQEFVDELRDGFSEVELAELILVAGQANLNNRAGNAAKRLLGRREHS